MDYEITAEPEPSDEDLSVLEDGYQAFTEAQIGEEGRRVLTYFIRDDKGTVVGGVRGQYTNYKWLWVGLLWVSEELRGRGYGFQLMTSIEQEAKSNGCTDAYLNSFSFQAVKFYKKIGYRVYGELKDFPPGHSVCAMTKKLA